MIIDSPIISGSSVASGSLNQFGNVTITGSLNVTGGITGSISGSATTASYASNAELLDGLDSTVFTLTSSFIAFTASLNAKTSSFATTGSNAFIGTQTITGSILQSGSFTSTGTITAQTLIVQTITSSTEYSSGSNTFGNSLANIQVLTGSVSITGSLAVNGSNVVLSNQTSSMSASYALNATSASYANNATTASYALNATSASYATNARSSSYSNNSTSASYANNATTASYALVAAAGGFPYTGSAQITGSLGVTGSVTATSFTGSLLGTSSYANYSLTSSYSLAGSGFPFSGSAVITGSLLVTNLSSSGVSYLVADAAGFVTAQTASAAIKSTQAVTSTAGQTSFTITNGYTTGLVDVYINGTKLSAVEYTDTSGTVITLATGSNNGDTVEFVKYFPASGVTNNALRQQTTITASAGQTVFSASYTPGLLDIYYNGARLSTSDYTANSGTYFTLATASAASDILDVLVYSYQVGAFSGIGGTGIANQFAYFNTTNSITSSTAITISGANAIVTGSLLGTASYSNDAGTLDGLDSTVFTLTSSFIAQTASFTAFTSSINSFSASILTFTSSATTRLGALEAATASLYSATSSFSGRVGALESYTASLNAKTASFATTGSNNFTGVQHIADTTNPTGFDSTGSLYSEGGLHLKKDAYISSSLYIKGNLTVYGTQSVSYITSSQLNISTNIITVNTSTPSIRFGGLAVQDSGSAGGLTGSLLWDSQNNNWLYSNPSGSGNYDSSMVIMGPRNSSTLGNEVGLNCNYLVLGHGSHHTTSSAIFHDGSTTCFPGTACANIFTAATISAGIPTNSRIVANSNTMYGYYDVETNYRWALGRDVWAGGSGGLSFGVGGTTTCYSMIGDPSGYGCTIAFAILVPNGCSGTTYEKMRITSGGNVGIGTSSPLQTSANRTVLTVNGTSQSIINLGYSGTLGGYFYADSSGAEIYSAKDLLVTSTGACSTLFYTNGAERMRITSCGKIGIGATNPLWLLEVCCNTTATGGGGYPAIAINNPNDIGYSALYFFKGANNFGGLEFSNTTCHLFVNTICTFAIQTNNIERLRVNNNGFIGVATNSPKAQLDVACGNAHGIISTWCKGAASGTMYNAFDIYMDEASFAGQLYVQANGAGIGIQATYDVLASYDRICIIPRNSMTRGQGETLTIPSYTVGGGSKRICIQQSNTSTTSTVISAMLIGTAYGGSYICAQA